MRTLDDYHALCIRMTSLLADRVEFTCEPALGEVLAAHPKLVYAVSHSTPLSWLPVPFVLGINAVANGGGGRRPLGAFHRAFHRVPIVRRVIGYLSQGQPSWSFNELVAAMNRGDYTDFVVFPEGHNALVGSATAIRPFVSSRYLELALRVGAPVLVVAHQGTEGWAVQSSNRALLRLVNLFAPEIGGPVLDAGAVTLPMYPHRMPVYRMACRLYRPRLTLSDLSTDRAERQAQLDVESQGVRKVLQQLLAGLSDQRRSQDTRDFRSVLFSHTTAASAVSAVALGKNRASAVR